MTDETAQTDRIKRFRSPPYPMFDLHRAIERVTEVYGKAGSHSVGVTVLAEAWGMKSADGKVWRTAATLIQYGLMTDSGTGKARKFQLSDSARRIILDTDLLSEKRKDAIRKAAMGPMIHRELWEKYGAAFGLSDTVMRTHLTIDREDLGEAPYSPSAADEVISIYRSTIGYAGVSEGVGVESIQPNTTDDVAEHISNLSKIAEGEWVRWISNGIVQFDAKKVDWVSNDGKLLRVFGNPKEIPVEQVQVVEAPMKNFVAAEPVVKTENPKQFGIVPNKKLDATLYVENGRLQLTANVGLEEIEDLRSVLLKYAEILQLLS